MNSFGLILLEVIAIIIVFIIAGCFIAEIVMIIKKKIRQKRNRKVLEGYKLADEKTESIAEQVISKHVRDNRREKEREEEYKLKTKKDLKRPSLLHRIIVKAWQKKEEEGIWSPVHIVGKNKREKIRIEVRGERRDAFPHQAVISLADIPGFESYVSKELAELTGEEKRNIESWIALNTPTE